jgi:PhnB protein
MKTFNAYLNFDGKTSEAMTFYSKCLGAELLVMPWSEAPPGTCDVPKEFKDKVMHARLTKEGSAILMASDTPPGRALQAGNNFSINIDCASRQEGDKLFNALGEKGTVVMPMQDMFWGSYWGMVTDRFGINWMFNCEQAQKA